MRLAVLIFFLFFNFSGHALCLDPGGVNLTKDFDQLYQSSIEKSELQNLISDLKDYTILIIPGIDYDFMEDFYFGNNLSFLRKKIYRLIELREYFKDYKDFFRDHGLKFNILGMDEELYPHGQEKLVRIMDLIKKSKGNLLFLVHSKGGLDLLEVLIALKKSNDRNAQSTLDRIKGAIFLQTPFLGSSLADLMVKNEGLFEKSANYFLSFFTDFNQDKFAKLSTSYRKQWVEENRDDFNYFLEKMNFLSFSSYMPRNKFAFRYPFFIISRNLIYDHFNLDNDGIVTCGSGYPAANFIIKDNLDHVRTVRASTFLYRKKDIDRKKLFLTLMSLWLKQNP